MRKRGNRNVGRKRGRRGRAPTPKNRVPVLDAGSFSQLLATSNTDLACSFLPEPQLLFGDKQPCEDPRTGLTAFGPYSKTDATRRETIRLGVVGPSEAVDRALRLIERMKQAIQQSEKLDAMLHPSFPGMNEGEPFQVQLVSQPVWQRTLRASDVAQVEKHPDFTMRVSLLRGAVKNEILALRNLDAPPDIVLVAMSERLEQLCRVGIAEHDAEQRKGDADSDEVDDVIEEASADDDREAEDEEEIEGARSFRRALKADALNILPTQLLWHRTLAGTRGVQDLSTRAWNLTVAILYKAGIVPWRLADVMAGSCFVGISFFHPEGAESSTLRTSVAQAFTDRGEGFVLQGDTFEWDSRKEQERAPHLSREAAKNLLDRVLKVYESQIGSSPARVTLHKSSRFTADERTGFEDAMESIPHYAMVNISRRGIVCLRPGNKATLRGTLVDFGQKRGLLYTTGYIPFLRCYPGFRIPQPLEILENWGSLSLQEVAEDIMRLTKLNWNTAAFCCVDPITLAFSRRVGDILKMANTKDPALHYRYYM